MTSAASHPPKKERLRQRRRLLAAALLDPKATEQALADNSLVTHLVHEVAIRYADEKNLEKFEEFENGHLQKNQKTPAHILRERTTFQTTKSAVTFAVTPHGEDMLDIVFTAHMPHTAQAAEHTSCTPEQTLVAAEELAQNYCKGAAKMLDELDIAHQVAEDKKSLTFRKSDLVTALKPIMEMEDEEKSHAMSTARHHGFKTVVGHSSERKKLRVHGARHVTEEPPTQSRLEAFLRLRHAEEAAGGGRVLGGVSSNRQGRVIKADEHDHPPEPDTLLPPLRFRHD